MSSINSISSGHSSYTMQQMKQKPNASEIADNIFSLVDTKNQGSISSEQFTGTFGTSDSSKSKASALFSAMDSDSSGSLTKEELTASLEAKMQAASSQFQTRMSMQQGSQQEGDMPPPPPQGGMGGMPPGPPPEDDKGLTKDQLTEKSQDTSDKMSSLFSTLANNFEAADSDKDGKVTAKEAKAYETSQQTGSTTTSSTSTTSTATTGSTSSSSTDTSAQLQRQLDALMRMYNINTASNSTSTSISASA